METQGDNKKLTHQDHKRIYADAKKRMVRKLLALGYNMGMDKPESPAEERMERWRVNMNHVNRWLLSDKSAVKKTMDKMTHDELTNAITQLTEIYKYYLKKL